MRSKPKCPWCGRVEYPLLKKQLDQERAARIAAEKRAEAAEARASEERFARFTAENAILKLFDAMDYCLGKGWRDETLCEGDEVNTAWMKMAEIEKAIRDGGKEKRCETCRYHGDLAGNAPCADCRDWDRWEGDK